MGNLFARAPTAKDLHEIYYIKNVNPGNNQILRFSDNSLKEQVQLSFSLENIKEYHNYSLVINLADSTQSPFKLIAKTQPMYASTKEIHFPESSIINYYFEKQQLIEINLYEDNTCKVKESSTIGKIMGSKGQTCKFQTEAGTVVIDANSIKGDNNKIFSLKIQGEVHHDKILSLYYNIKKHSKNREILVYKSEVVAPYNAHFQFKNFEMLTQLVGDSSEPLTFTFYDFNKGSEICKSVFRLDELAYMKKNKVCLDGHRGHTQLKPALTLLIDGVFRKEYTFVDYLRGGMQIALSVGIDFTASNGDPKNTSSLHYFNDLVRSPYEIAIKSCGEIVGYYDFDQLFPVYGYGALIDNRGQANHCFPVNFSINDPNIQGIDNIVLAYRNCIYNVKLHGPTYFAPILRQCISNVLSENNPMVYHIIMILTDGAITDMKETIDQLVVASELPISVIIIGIGDGDFTNMDILDADDDPLYDSFGKKASRDLVQFVPFNKFRNNGEKLAEEVLEEVPRQVIEYYKMRNMPPGDPIVKI